MEAVTTADEGSVETLSLESIVSVTSLVVDPFLVDVVVQPRLYSHNEDTTRVDTNVGSNGIENIDGFSVLEFPRSCFEGVRFRGESSNGAEIDNVS